MYFYYYAQGGGQMETEFSNKLYVRLIGTDQENDSVIPLADLAKSLNGLEQVIEDFIRICRFNGELVLTAKPPEEGSFVIGICVDLKLSYGQLPFDHIKHLLDFLRLSSDTAWKEAHNFFKELNNLRGGLNLYFEKHPFDLWLLAYIVPKLIILSKKMKKSPLPPDDKTPKRVAKELHNMIKRNGFKNLLWPIINDSVESIEVSQDRSFTNNTSHIGNDDLDQLLCKDNEILPELVNGEIYKLTGVISSLKSTRGDSLTFHYITKEGCYNLDLLPPTGLDSKNYISFYKENVVINAKVDRISIYKKPKLKLVDIELTQPDLLYITQDK